MMRVAVALSVWLLCSVASWAEKLPVMSDDAARNLGLKPGEYTTEAAQSEGGKPGVSAGAGAELPIVRANGLTDDQQRLISGSDLPARRERRPSTRGPRRETGTGGAASERTDRPRTTANSQPAAPTAPPVDGAAPVPSGADVVAGNPSAAAVPPKAAQAPRVDRGSTSRIESKLQSMKSAIGGLNADAGALGASPKPAAPDPGRAGPAPAASAAPAPPLGVAPERVSPASGASEPRALVRRPDFYNVIPRSRYESLKGSFAASAGARPEFQDMGVKDRDFIWTRSCDRVSGGCNPLAAEKSYKKNDDVAPETLASVWKKLKESSESGADDGWADYVKEQRKAYEEGLEREARAEGIRAKLSRSIFAAGSRLGGLLRNLVNASRGGSFDGSASFASYVEAGGPGDGAAAPGPTARPRSGARAVAGRHEEELLLPSESSSPPWGRIAFALLGALALGLAVRFLLKRRDEDAHVRLAPLIKGRDEEKP